MGDLIWLPFVTLTRREIARFMKVVAQTVITPFVSASLYLLIFGVNLGESIKLASGLPYLSFLIPGLVMMGCLNNAFQNTSSSIIASKFSGDLEDLKASPLSPMQIIMAMSIGAVVRGLCVAGITLLVGELFYYFNFGEILWPSHPGLLLTFLLVGGLTFGNLGISVGFAARSFDQLSALGGFVLLPLIYLGGVFFSVETLPAFWRGLAMSNPLLYLING
ncbi:MAG: ABC transporter permease, partial [Bdellovibrionales bacterium]